MKDTSKLLSYNSFVRPADYIVRVNHILQNQDGKIDGRWASIVVHELTHYYQLTGTSVGYRISQLSRLISAYISKLLEHLPGICIPLNEWLRNNKELVKKTEIRILLEVLSSYQEEYEFLSRPWPNKVFLPFLRSKARNIDIGYFFRHKPIEVNIQGSFFQFITPEGKLFNADFTSYQIMESMAVLVQMQRDGLIVKDRISDFVETCTNMLQLQYYFPMLYMLQEGITDHPGSIAFLYDYLMCVSQISLMLNPQTLWKYGRGKYKDLAHRLDPGRIYLECLLRPEIGAMFFSNVLKHEPNWLTVCDKMCDMLKIPPYSFLLQLAMEEAIEDKKIATDVEYNKVKRKTFMKHLQSHGVVTNEIKLPLAESRGKQIDITIHILKRILKNPAYILDPIAMIDIKGPASAKDNLYVPPPPIQDLDGQIFVVHGDKSTWEASLYNAYENYIPNKLFYDSNLACYSSIDGSDQMIPCQHFDACREKAKNDIIDFCVNERWHNIVKDTLLRIGVKKCLVITHS